MYRNAFKIAILLTSIAHGSNAQTFDEDARLVIANFIYETVECVSFYSIISNMDNNSREWIGLAANYKNLVEEMSMIALNLANQIQLGPDVLMLKLQQYTDEMGELIGYDAINISLLLEKHGETCKNLVEFVARAN